MRLLFSLAMLMLLTGAASAGDIFAHYPLNGNGNDDSGNAQNLVLVGTPTSINAVSGTGYSLNGNSQDLENNSAGIIYTMAGPVSLSWWMKVNKASTYGDIVVFSNKTGTAPFFYCRWDGTGGTTDIIFCGGKNSTDTDWNRYNASSPNFRLTAGTWYHVFVNHTATRTTYFVNGVDRGVSYALVSGMGYNSGYFSLGATRRSGAATTNYGNVSLDEVYVFNSSSPSLGGPVDLYNKGITRVNITYPQAGQNVTSPYSVNASIDVADTAFWNMTYTRPNGTACVVNMTSPGANCQGVGISNDSLVHFNMVGNESYTSTSLNATVLFWAGNAYTTSATTTVFFGVTTTTGTTTTTTLKNSWRQVADKPVIGGALGSTGQRAFAGAGAAGTLVSWFEYNKSWNNWTSRTDKDSKPGWCTFLDPAIICVGMGANTTWGINQTVAYYPNNDTWETWTSYPAATFFDGSLIACNGAVYEVGGQQGMDNLNSTNQTWMLNVTTRAWTRKADYPRVSGIDESQAVLCLGGNIYNGMGMNRTQANFADWQMYNITTDTWTAKPNYPYGASRIFGSFNIGDRGYVVGGYNNSAIDVNVTAEYDYKHDKWIRVADMISPIRGERCAELQGEGICTSGRLDPDYRNWTFIYTQGDLPNLTSSTLNLSVVDAGRPILATVGVQNGTDGSDKVWVLVNGILENITAAPNGTVSLVIQTDHFVGNNSVQFILNDTQGRTTTSGISWLYMNTCLAPATGTNWAINCWENCTYNVNVNVKNITVNDGPGRVQFVNSNITGYQLLGNRQSCDLSFLPTTKFALGVNN